MKSVSDEIVNIHNSSFHLIYDFYKEYSNYYNYFNLNWHETTFFYVNLFIYNELNKNNGLNSHE